MCIVSIDHYIEKWKLKSLLMCSPSRCSWANITNIIMNITTIMLNMIIIINMNTVSKSLLMWSPLCSCTNKSTPAPSLHLIQNSKQGIVILFKSAHFRTIVGHKLSHIKRSRRELTREDQSRLTLFLCPQQALTSRAFWLRVGFGSGLTKKFGFRVRVRVLCILWS